MATSTDVPIYTNTLTGTASSVTIDLSAYQDYTDVKIVYSAQSSGGNAVLGMRFNGDSGSNYSSTYAYGTGSTAASGKETSQTAISAGDIPSSGSSAFSANTIYLHNYSNTNTYKTALMRHNSPGVVTVMSVGTWRSTSAITSVTLTGTFNTGSTFSVYGIGTASLPVKATGGAIYTDTDYVYHVFGSTGTFTPTQSLTADILVVAGGGAGGSEIGGGGGAGGLITYTSQSLTTTGYTCTVGAGAGRSSGGTSGGNGSNSQFGALTAAVGGGGGGYYAANGISGGSGGGAGRNGSSGGSATSGQGYAGGSGTHPSPTGGFGGGGGGAGAVGQNAQWNGTVGTGGAGGIGATSSLINAIGLATGAGQTVSNNTYFAGGGGGGAETYGTGISTGGYGGGGAGGYNGVSIIAGVNGVANTGSGGGAGGGTAPATGGAGGSGVVIVRYAK